MQANLALGNLSDPRLTDPQAAAEYLASIRWPNGPVCPHCGTAEAERKNKAAVMTLVERGGRARSTHVARVTADELKPAIREHVERDAAIVTDEWRSYRGLGREFASHDTVSHAEGEYVRGAVHTNTVEG